MIDVLGASTQLTPNPWMNIELVQSTTIAVVILLEMYYYDYARLDSDVRIGTSSTVALNAFCIRV